jgi:hypothetical protein
MKFKKPPEAIKNDCFLVEFPKGCGYAWNIPEITVCHENLDKV